MEVDESNDVIIKMIIKLFRQTIEAVPLQYFDCKGVLCMKQHWPMAKGGFDNSLILVNGSYDQGKE